MTATKAIIVLTTMVGSAATAFVARPPLAAPSHLRSQQQQSLQQQQRSLSTVSLMSTLTSNETDASSASASASTIRQGSYYTTTPIEQQWDETPPWELASKAFLEERKRMDYSVSPLIEMPSIDPSLVEICDSDEVNRQLDQQSCAAKKNSHDTAVTTRSNNIVDPFGLMMQQSAPYIAQHLGQTCVFHIPGNLMEDKETSDKLLADLAMAYVLGMKIVVVVGNRYDWDLCNLEASTTTSSQQAAAAAAEGCQRALQVTNEETLRQLEEEAGYWRTEVERKLNRCLHGVCHHPGNRLEGNVISGNFYTAKRVSRGKRSVDDNNIINDNDDYEYTGYASKIHSETIHRILEDNHDVVVLTTVGLCKNGQLVNVNGYHLAASVAASLDAYKVVYMAHKGSVLQQKTAPRRSDHDGVSTTTTQHHRVIQELPNSFAKTITDYHKIRVHHKQGFASFPKEAQQEVKSPRDLELLLHLGWATWAVERGVTRAHIVNPTNGALLEELFTSKNGANTCIFHDRELLYLEDDDLDNDEEEIFWDDEEDDVFSSQHQRYGNGDRRVWPSSAAFAAKKNHHDYRYNHKDNNKRGGRNW